MKISTVRLKEIIKEEIEKLEEVSHDPEEGAEANPVVDAVTDAAEVAPEAEKGREEKRTSEVQTIAKLFPKVDTKDEYVDMLNLLLTHLPAGNKGIKSAAFIEVFGPLANKFLKVFSPEEEEEEKA